ncbi:MAG: response regulator transcription factor [Geothrix sp.]|jgi:DNA-binding response OmpR family regulator|nr:response regulator transcription factor [Geothrix sp.]
MVVLIAEPDEAEARRMLEGLTSEGFLCEWARTGPEALARASACEALVAEIALPGVSGMDLVGRLRDSGITTPLIFVTALCTPEHRVRGLEAGADDYLCKPFTLPELAARLRALIRRSRMPSRVRRVGVADLVWEPDLRRVHRGEQRLDLTPKEYTLLALLLERPGQVVSREEMALALWGGEKHRPDLRSPNALDAQIRRLRAKVDDPFDRPLLHTQRGRGLVIEVR